MRVEVVSARRDGAQVVAVSLPAGATVGDALNAAGLAFDPQCVGIFGRRVTVDTPVSDQDRVEIYRPLALDPKEGRRRRARKRRR